MLPSSLSTYKGIQLGRWGMKDQWRLTECVCVCGGSCLASKWLGTPLLPPSATALPTPPIARGCTYTTSAVHWTKVQPLDAVK